MKRITLATLVAVGLMASSISLFARVLTATGACDNGSHWIIVTTLDNMGRVTSIRGTNCQGVTWTGHCSITELPTDPNQPSAFYHQGEAGDWVRYDVNSSGVITTMWGKDTEGHYWTTEAVGIQLA